MQSSTHGLTLGEREIRKEFVADHEQQAERGTTEGQARHFMALLAHH